MPVWIGNAATDGAGNRGWFVGHFVPSELGERSSEDVEVKWGIHVRGEERRAWARSERATTLSVLVRGAFTIAFQDGQQVRLERPGDYALWGPGVAHRWSIEQDETVIMTVRWPSRAGDAADVQLAP